MPLPASSRLEGAQFSALTSKMHRPTNPTDAMFRKKEQKDAELDKKIEALRKKNEALMKRYKEVEEDKKRAEEEGMTFLGRKAKAEDLTITIKTSPSESRVVMKKTGSVGHSFLELGQGESGEPFCLGRGKRRQLMVTMANKTKGKRIVSEKTAQNCPASPSILQDYIEEMENREAAGRGKQLHFTKVEEGRQDFENLIDASEWLFECDPFYKDIDGHGAKSQIDLNVPTSKEEQLEYIRWKKEREQIDRERVARHKNAKGQWRRAWDMDKTENMFRESFHSDGDCGNVQRVGKNTRKFNLRPSNPESRGTNHRSRDKTGNNVPAVSSKAKGKDRLTGRARRWDCTEEEDYLQRMQKDSEDLSDSLEALGGPEVDEPTVSKHRKDWHIKGDADTANSTESVDSEGKEGVKESELVTSDSCDGQLEIAVGIDGETQGGKVVDNELRVNRLVDSGALPQRTRKTEGHLSAQKTPVSLPSGVHAAKTLREDSENLKAQSEAPGEQQTSGICGQISKVTHSPLQKVVSEVHQDRLLMEEGPVLSNIASAVTVICDAEIESLSSGPGQDHSNMDLNPSLLTEEKTDELPENSKSNKTRSPEEIIDSSLSVMSRVSGASLPDYKTSTVKVGPKIDIFKK
ncbi:coiled-coil domain-containing protein 9B isoform X2 [Amia ocellicauda]|uniref:coiled-coil domain-containing protein 9B isoform X2 n=1 Tax=Amia ocellicauda TaxID=2972642 RepID=UPI003464AF13